LVKDVAIEEAWMISAAHGRLVIKPMCGNFLLVPGGFNKFTLFLK
jgi:hypothetical protein